MKSPVAVLVVDDDFSGRTMMGLSLRHAGFSVDTAPDGAEALRLLETRRYDWLVTDAKMQPMDGFELSVKAKRLRPELNIVMVSALYTDRDAGGFPIDKFIPKPFSAERLLAALSENSA